MSDLEPSLRRLLEGRAASVPSEDGPPPAVLRRARRRRLRNQMGVGVVAVLAMVGIGAQFRPAERPADVVSVPNPTAPTCADPATSSRSDFDPEGGQYAVYLYGVNASLRTVSFDVIQFLRGDDAVEAYRRDNPAPAGADPDAGGPPGGAYVVNAFVHTDQAAVATEVAVRVVDPSQPTVLVTTTLDRIPAGPRGLPGLGLYWLSFRDGVVTQVCQQDSTARVGGSTPEVGSGGVLGTGCADLGTSSRSDFDPRRGQYAVYLYGVNSGLRTVAFDVVQFLVGDDAAQAYHRDNPTDPGGPPGAYYLVNAYENTDEAAVDGGARVRLVDPSRPAALVSGELADVLSQVTVGSHPAYGLYWLTLDDGHVTDICQQATP